MYLCISAFFAIFFNYVFEIKANPLDLQQEYNLETPGATFSKIGTQSMRKIGRRYEPPQYMLDLYNQFASKDSSPLLPYGATMARGVIEKDSGGGGTLFTFSFSGVPPNESFIEAEFQFHHHRLEDEARHLLGKTKMYRLEIKTHSADLGPSDWPPQLVSGHTSGRAIFKVGSTVRRAKDLGHTSVAFVVRARTIEGRPLPLVIHHGVRGSKSPILVLFSDASEENSPEVLFPNLKGKSDFVSTRTKRSLTDNTIEEEKGSDPPIIESIEYSPITTCHLSRFYVDFEEIGWNWVVAPLGYNANQCSGTCSLPFEHQTNHAIIRNLFLSTNRHYVESPSCVPTSYNSLALLYVDEDNNVILKKFEHIIATECGCR